MYGSDFKLDPDQEMICDAAAVWLAEQSGSAAVRRAMATGGHDAGLWQAMRAELGWCALAIPDTYGGMGLGQVERGLLMEQLGRRLACVPYLASACLASDALLHAATPQACARYLPQLAEGSLGAALALPSPDGWQADACSFVASRSARGYRLGGSAELVPGAAQAGLLLVPARLDWEPGRCGLFAVDASLPGVELAQQEVIDQTRPIARLALDRVALAPAARIDAAGSWEQGLEKAIDLARLALAAEQVGGAWQCLDLTLAYVAQRRQFGRSIASFQAVKHRCAHMKVALEAARSTVYGAARAAGALSGAALSHEVACAKSCANEAFFLCAQEAIQLHGGAGFTWEYDPQLYFKRAQASRHWLGSDAWCEAQLARQLDNPMEQPSAPAPSSACAPDGEDQRLRAEVAQWMAASLAGEYALLRHRGAPGDEQAFVAERKRWERELAAAGWTCVGWPRSAGGRGLPLAQQLIFHEEYARAGGPGRPGHIGEGLIGPTILAFGSPEQQARHLPGIRAGCSFWCQGFSEPDAGSDLSNVQTRAVRDPDSGEWIVHGQKLWTSLAHESDWIFLLARCAPGSRGREGLVFLLVPLAQPGVEVRPVRQLGGSAEFNEVFFDGARAAADDVLGEPGEGWHIAMSLLGFERGASTLGQQMHFRHELALVLAAARANGAWRDPAILRRLGRAGRGLRTMRYNSLRMLSGGADLGDAGLIYKYYWSNWHRDLGQLAMDVLGAQGNIVAPDASDTAALQRLFLFSRADTIYAGTNEIQLNIIAERGLGMPREARA